jgi:Asp-tRNA(Asn)/Glu-tRNA(Gln) amidotransferase A subunit family amidase
MCIESTSQIFKEGVKNPYDETRTTGGSTSGDAAMLALNCVPLCFASDSAGSVRLPASFCGLYSLKPTTLRISNRAHGARYRDCPGFISVDGPVGRSVEDLELAMQVITEKEAYANDHLVAPVPWRSEEYERSGPLVIGYVLEDNSIIDTPACSSRAVQMSVDALRAQGHTLVPFNPPNNYTAFLETVK